MPSSSNLIRYCLSVSSLLLIVGCGGGAGSTSSLTSFTLSGIAATGVAISNGTVEAKCETGTGTTTSNFDGTFTMEIANGALPCMLRAIDPVTKLELHSVAESGATRVNITPLTELIAAKAMGNNLDARFSTFSKSDALLINVNKITDAKNYISSLAIDLGIRLSWTDPLKDVFIAATSTNQGDIRDRQIDSLMAFLSSAGENINSFSGKISANTSTSEIKAIVSELKSNAAKKSAENQIKKILQNGYTIQSISRGYEGSEQGKTSVNVLVVDGYDNYAFVKEYRLILDGLYYDSSNSNLNERIQNLLSNLNISSPGVYVGAKISSMSSDYANQKSSLRIKLEYELSPDVLKVVEYVGFEFSGIFNSMTDPQLMYLVDDMVQGLQPTLMVNYDGFEFRSSSQQLVFGGEPANTVNTIDVCLKYKGSSQIKRCEIGRLAFIGDLPNQGSDQINLIAQKLKTLGLVQ